MRKFFAACSFFLFFAPHVFAITIDDFTAVQFVQDNPGGGPQRASVASTTSIGGFRNVELEATSGNPVLGASLSIDTGLLRHSQDVTVGGRLTVTWDGDNDPAALNQNGLGGINFSQDGSTQFDLDIDSFDYPNQQPVTFRMILYSTDGGASFAEQVLSAPINPSDNVIVTLPYFQFALLSGFSNPADITKIGAVQLLVIANNAPALDLRLRALGTNTCEQVPDPNGSVVNECGMCGQPGSSCYDCLGVFMGTAKLDRCGVCNGDGTSCLGCESHDRGDEITDLDQCINQQTRIVNTMLKKATCITEDKAGRRFSQRVKKEIQTLTNQTWRLLWDKMSIKVKKCSHQMWCTTDYQDSRIMAEYSENAARIREAAADIMRYNKKCAARRCANDFRRLDDLFRSNIKKAGVFDISQSVCR